MYEIIKNLNPFIIGPDLTVKESLKKLNQSGKNILIVVNKKKFRGILQGGDIRRQLIKNIKINETIKKIYNKKGIYLYSDDKNLKKKLSAYYKNIYLEGVPIINRSNKKLEFLAIFKKRNFENLKYSVVVMAGGKGKRMGSLTQKTPKPLLKVKNISILEHIFKNLKKNNLNDIYVLTKYFHEKVMKFCTRFSKKNTKIKVIREKRYLGTAGGLSLFKQLEFDRLLVLNGDVIVNTNINHLLRHHENEQNDVTVCTKEGTFNIPYGLVKGNIKKIIKVEEKPSFVVRYNAGIYLFNKKALKLLKTNQSIEMPNFINFLNNKKIKVGQYNIYEKLNHFTSPNDLQNLVK